MAEYIIENTVVNKAKAAGWFCRKVEWIGRRTCPDRVFIKSGRTVWIEFKGPTKRATESQDGEHEAMRSFGAEVHVVNNVLDGLKILGLA